MEQLARAAISGMPEQFRSRLGDVVIKVEEFATREQLDAVGSAATVRCQSPARPLIAPTLQRSHS